jgi:hypothetical protein
MKTSLLLTFTTALTVLAAPTLFVEVGNLQISCSSQQANNASQTSTSISRSAALSHKREIEACLHPEIALGVYTDVVSVVQDGATNVLNQSGNSVDAVASGGTNVLDDGGASAGEAVNAGSEAVESVSGSGRRRALPVTSPRGDLVEGEE